MQNKREIESVLTKPLKKANASKSTTAGLRISLTASRGARVSIKGSRNAGTGTWIKSLSSATKTSNT
jgi:ABC-type polysaccharide/polyol phosphate transport system ATPase subunit